MFRRERVTVISGISSLTDARFHLFFSLCTRLVECGQKELPSAGRDARSKPGKGKSMLCASVSSSKSQRGTQTVPAHDASYLQRHCYHVHQLKRSSATLLEHEHQKLHTGQKCNCNKSLHKCYISTDMKSLCIYVICTYI